jgi:predicted ester cyclase
MHVADDNTIIAEFNLLGTNLGPLLDGKPTGRSFRVATVAIFTFEGELITNERVYLDLATLLRQIGRDDLLQPNP